MVARIPASRRKSPMIERLVPSAPRLLGSRSDTNSPVAAGAAGPGCASGPNGSPPVGDHPQGIQGMRHCTDGKQVVNLPVSAVASGQPISSARAPMKTSGNGVRGDPPPDWRFLRLRYRRQATAQMSARGGRNVEYFDSPAADTIRGGSRFCLAAANLGETHRIDRGPFGGNRPRNRLLGPILRSALRRVEQHVRVQEHHGSRVIRRSFSHEKAMFSGDRPIASRHASRLISGASLARCRRTGTKRSSPSRCTSKRSPGLAPGITTRLLMSARTAFTGWEFPTCDRFGHMQAGHVRRAGTPTCGRGGCWPRCRRRGAGHKRQLDHQR